VHTSHGINTLLRCQAQSFLSCTTKPVQGFGVRHEPLPHWIPLWGFKLCEIVRGCDGIDLKFCGHEWAMGRCGVGSVE
jgi:hypothetical protein